MKVSTKKAISLLESGDVVALPTETVYGLAASLHHPEAIEKVFALKGRPSTNPLTIHCASFQDVLPFLKEVPPFLKEFAETYWPGSLTLVVPVDQEKVAEEIRAGLTTTGFRVPNQSQTIEVLKETGPCVMPSANLSGGFSATTPAHVAADFGEDLPVVDGECAAGFESTVIEFKEGKWNLLRQGMISLEELQKITEVMDQSKKMKSPISFKFFTTLPDDFSGTILGWNGKKYPSRAVVHSFGDPLQKEEVLQNFYRILRELSSTDLVYVDERIFLKHPELKFLQKKLES